MTSLPALARLTARQQALSVIPVWILAALCSVIVGFATERDGFLTWLPIVLATVVVVTFLIQLATRRTEGFVTRAMASIGGAVVILAVATGLLSLLR